MGNGDEIEAAFHLVGETPRMVLRDFLIGRSRSSRETVDCPARGLAQYAPPLVGQDPIGCGSLCRHQIDLSQHADFC
jgi:hypothetical protein